MKTLIRGVDWAAGRIQSGGSVLVQCEYGIGRSVLVTACLLVRLGDSPSEALARIRRTRPCVTPSPLQLDAFSRWCALQAQPQRAARADDSRRFVIQP
jgi:protein-tyrosine phosphatase